MIDIQGWQSPITEMQTIQCKLKEENLMLSVNQAVGYSVDKEELLKALKYDRDQYNKGFKDGQKAFAKKIKDKINEKYACALEIIDKCLSELEVQDESTDISI